jgi:glutathione synthase/RimK-type ligase-like ATP-grasp enzyme
MKVAIITCEKLPQGTAEDKPLFQRLKDCDINFDICIWSEDRDWSQYDVCLLRSVWDYHENIDAFNQWVEKVDQLTTLLNPPQLIKWNQSKYYLVELEEIGVTIAPTIWLDKTNANDFFEYCQNNKSESYILKPVIGADSSDTFRFSNNPDSLKEAHKHLRSCLPHSDMMLQPYLKSVEKLGETSLIYIHGEFTHAVRKIPVQGDYRVQDTYGAKDVTYQANAAELSLSKVCLQYIQNKFVMPFYVRFDFLHDELGTVYLNEAELIEPSLFFHHGPSAVNRISHELLNYLSVEVST